MSLAERRRCVSYLKEHYEISERRAWQAMQMNRSSYRYAPTEQAEDHGYRRTVPLSPNKALHRIFDPPPLFVAEKRWSLKAPQSKGVRSHVGIEGTR